MTLAPSDSATSAVRSVELLSTTMVSSTNSGMARRIFSIPCSSFRHGMIIVIFWPLYMAGEWRWYHDGCHAMDRNYCLLDRSGSLRNRRLQEPTWTQYVTSIECQPYCNYS